VTLLVLAGFECAAVRAEDRGTGAASDSKEFRLNTNPGGEGTHRADPRASTNDPSSQTSDYPYSSGVTSPIPVPRGVIRNGEQVPSVPRASGTR
jgi:hypothetical protein